MLQFSFAVTDHSQVGQARREAVRLAQHADVNQSCIDKVALIATELATNLVKHATSGQLLMRMLEDDEGSCVELLSLDQGPGMANVEICMEDGYSTAGSPGTGLGAIARAADHFDIYSHRSYRKNGTVAVARIGSSRHHGIGIVHQAKHGEPICGDAWLVKECEGGSLCVVADGHGLLAAQAATAIVDSLQKTRSINNSLDLLEVAHQAAKPTCGAAVGVAILDHDSHEVRFAGVGNISAVVLDGDVRHHLISHDGVVGQEYRTRKEFTNPWSKESVLVMHSDGLGTRWDLTQYPGLQTKDPSLIAGVLYQDFARPYDDVTVVVIKGHVSSLDRGI